MAKKKRDARRLLSKAFQSLRCGLSAFNGFQEDGRQTAVPLHLQHAAEMLIKAALAQGGAKLFDKEKRTSLGLEKCLGLAAAGPPVKLTADEAGTIRALDAMRDAEQHWMITVSENILFLHVRALVTVFDDIVKRVFGEALADHLPTRVLPLSTKPPASLDVLIDDEFRQISDLLKPGLRQRGEARGRIRTLLAMESHAADEEVRISEADIDRIERAVKNGKQWREIFPKLEDIRTEVHGGAGEPIELRVHFTKKQGAPIHYTDDPSAAAYREIDMQKRFHLSSTDLARKIGISVPKAAAMKRHFKLDENKEAAHVFAFGKAKHDRYSDKALALMTELKETADLDEIWQKNRK